MQPSIDDSFSGKNNIVTVRKSDFEETDTLRRDPVQQSYKTPISNY